MKRKQEQFECAFSRTSKSLTKHAHMHNTHTHTHIHTQMNKKTSQSSIFTNSNKRHCKSSLPRGGPDGGAPGGPIDTRHYITKLRGRHSALQTRHQPPGGPVCDTRAHQCRADKRTAAEHSASGQNRQCMQHTSQTHNTLRPSNRHSSHARTHEISQQ